MKSDGNQSRHLHSLASWSSLRGSAVALVAFVAVVPTFAQPPRSDQADATSQTVTSDDRADPVNSRTASDAESADGPVTDQKSSPVEQAVPESDTDAASAAAEQAETERERKRQTAVAALLVLGSVCMVLLLMILSVIVWARRVRRVAAQRLPDQHPGDPLWYLRNAERHESGHTTDTHP